MAAPALTAASSLAVLAIGGAANLVASNKPLQSKTWLRGGGFIGVINGRRGAAPVASPVAPAPTGSDTPSSPPATAPGTKKIYPIGGKTDKPMPPSPFGKFPKHRPTKLPGPPKSFDPTKGP